MIVTTFAPAKINLTLRVGPPRADGLHPIDSIVAFAATAGDWVSAAPSGKLSLEISGPFAGPLLDEDLDQNLVLKAARLLAQAAGVEPLAALRLDKYLPVASGIGGGSADAAAALRALAALWRLDAAPEDLERLAIELGSDAPACVRSRTARLSGIGEVLEPLRLPPLAGVLVNPGALCPTGPVYAAFDRLGGAPSAFAVSPDPGVEAVMAGGNDLEAAARTLVPAVGETLDALRAAAPDAIVRMSGSGATCFALTRDLDQAATLGSKLAVARPHWWVHATQLGDVDVAPFGG